VALPKRGMPINTSTSLRVNSFIAGFSFSSSVFERIFPLSYIKFPSTLESKESNKASNWAIVP